VVEVTFQLRRDSSGITAAQQPYLFNGKELDVETGLYYFGARYYDPRIGLWTAPDPLMLQYVQGTPNDGVHFPRNLASYTYAINNPIVVQDADGRAWWTKALKVGRAVYKGGDVAMAFADAIENYNIVTNANASTGERIWAGVQLLSEVAPVSVGDLKDAGRILGAIDDVGDASKTVKKIDNVADTTRDANGRLRNADGTFAYDGGRKAPTQGGTHGNTAGDQPATLYERYDAEGNFQKHGISQDPSKRYTQKELDGGYVVETQTGPRREMLKVERDVVETNPGPLNREPWAGSRKGQ
jgi:RHS repeat-associated protein